MESSSRQDGRPSFQWYPDDWLAEAGLRLCDLAARGLWIELLCHMFKMPERGVLRRSKRSKGQPMPKQEIAALVGRPEAEVEAALKQLIEYGVAGTAEDGSIYSRRMRREAKQERTKREAGRKGGLASGRSRRERKGRSPSPSPAPSPSSSTEKTKEKASARSDEAASSGPAMPADFEGLELYQDGSLRGVKRLWERWESLKAGAEQTWPGIDVAFEMRKAHAWEVANPARRKVDKVRFLNSWFNRAQDHAGKPEEKSIVDQALDEVFGEDRHGEGH